MHVTSETAEAAIKAAQAKATELKTQMCIAIVDSGANLKAFFRMDNAWVSSIDISHKKAKTAVFFGMPTGEIGKLSQPGGSLFDIEHFNDGLITFPGGLPIVDDQGVLVGAFGVSGSSVEDDHAVAQAGVDVLGVHLSLPRHRGRDPFGARSLRPSLAPPQASGRHPPRSPCSYAAQSAVRAPPRWRACATA